ncbi:MAG: glycosyltransferase [Oculatellaceae cyanobacterium Prado106]|jgi:hypothetical protein|nr:glycosyltransferase [Oculatellaceae cyanobacterium Prado106]
MLILLCLSLLTCLIYGQQVWQAANQAPKLRSLPDLAISLPKISVIVPAYNEADNINDCVQSILSSTERSPEFLEVWVVDDQSTDETVEMVRSLQAQLNDPRLHLLLGKPRPTGEYWVGKNWACAQAAEQATGDYFLFLDADLRLKRGAIEAALADAVEHQADLLSTAPAVACGCLAEWLVQPLIITTLLIGFRFQEVNDPNHESAFAAGMFMLFRRAAYEKIGGHRAVASEVVEDLELAKRTKTSGLKLRYLLSSQQAEVRMYRSWSQLWEGWTKNLFLGSQKNWVGMAKFIVALLLICVVPWLGLGVAIAQGLHSGWNGQNLTAIALSLLIISLHYIIRRIGQRASQIPPRYWLLSGLGGFLTVMIAIASIFKTETGQGWTWRGRSLKQS